MISNRIYYTVKPFIPRPMRLTVRRWWTRRRVAQYREVWPINERVAKEPKGWPGWPDGKKFGFVLTHDVEGQRGLERVKQLRDMEGALGFRSSFNFIPEGDYRSGADLRNDLVHSGFEVGVHDLRHDGKLFRSLDDFTESAERINRYLQEWNAVGFRGGFMLRNLEWLGRLNIKYDASTFDTDPFEPQPDGAGTIFPFWVSRDNGPAYLELPYTLAQDSTLFLLLEQTTTRIWKEKLDWIAKAGGMVLLDTHPDYMDFSGKPGRSEYAASMYREFLEFVKTHYAGQYWHALPREVAAHCEAKFPGSDERPAQAGTQAKVPVSVRSNLKGKRVGVALFSYYPSDPRPRRSAEAMAKAGMLVDLICLREKPDEPREEVINGVRVTRVPLTRRRGGKLVYVFQYLYFAALCFWVFALRTLKNRYNIIHVHNMPDFLVFSAIVPKMSGAKVILDLHDPMPELMMAIYSIPAKAVSVRFLNLVERASIAFADLVLTPNITFKNLFASRNRHPDKIQIVMNSPQPQIFDPDQFGPEAMTARKGEFRVMHHGSIVSRHGVDLLVEAVAKAKAKIPGIQLHIYGSKTSFLDNVLETAARCKISDIVHYHGPKSQTEIAAAIRECHLGVVPNRRSAFTETNFPTRLFEYLSMHRPVIAPSTRGILDYFEAGRMIYFEPNNVDNLAAQIVWAYENFEEVEKIIARGIEIYRQNLWPREEARLLDRVEALIGTKD
jgi:glycosyltransferase involved in cell wall biosynthesis